MSFLPAQPVTKSLHRSLLFPTLSHRPEKSAHLHATLPAHVNEKEVHMLWTIFVILLVLWLLGLVSSYTLGGFIHLLLIIAVIVLVIQLIQGRTPRV